MKQNELTQLQQKVKNIILDVVTKIDRVDVVSVEAEKSDAFESVSIDFDGDRCGDAFFTPRPHEEDDDFPDFTGRRAILQGLRRYVGPQCSIDAYDHEKGLFTVSIRVPKMKRGDSK